MDGQNLAKLERMARNLPLKPGELHTGTVKTSRGDILLAWGRGHDQSWYGLWCIDRQWRAMARTSEGGWALDEAAFKQNMLNDAYNLAGLMDERKLFDPSAKFSDKPA